MRLQAARLEQAGDLTGALAVYEAALAAAPGDLEILSALAGLAGRADMHEQAAALWSRVMAADPGRSEAVDGCARAFRALGRFSEAVELLRGALLLQPQEHRLWTALGVTLTYAGRAEEALTFFDEAIRLDGRSPTPFHNRALARCDLGDTVAAQADFAEARKLVRKPAEQATIDFALATQALGRGDLQDGWALYERRLSPDWPGSVLFAGQGRRWAPGAPLAGRSLLVLAEQGVGDEILFANLLPDVLDELSPGGRLVLAVDARLVDLVRRSFPAAEVGPHATEQTAGRRRRRAAEPPSGRIDLWSPLGSLARAFRRSIEDFPAAAYLRADPARVEHWRRWLGPERPAVGLTWRSGKAAGERHRFYPALADWADLLRTPGVQFVNLQYGEFDEDLAALSAMSGAEIRQPPAIDLKNDLDELAALCVALDLVVAVNNATGALAGACGGSVVLVTAPGSWTQLGTARIPWYPAARVCAADRCGDWAAALAEAAGFVADLARR